MRSCIDRCVTFLETNRDFGSCGGGVGGISLYAREQNELSQVVGPIDRRYGCYNPYYAPHDFSAPSVAQRIRERFNGSYALYYNVFRTDELRTIYRELADLNFSVLHLYETYFGMRAKSLSKSRFDVTVMSYLRQHGTSMNFHLYHSAWANHLARSRFRTDFDALVDRLSRIVAQTDGVDAATVAEEIRLLYGKKLDEHLRYCYRPGRSRYHPVSILKNGLRALSLDGLINTYRRVLHSRIVWRVFHRRNRAANIKEWRSCRATDRDVADVSRELAAIEDTLEGG